jgi:putative ABC transport system ATP-binding protein
LSELAVCRGLTKEYATSTGRVEALEDVDATFSTPGITAVVGPSGSGKSTLLRLLAGLERPTRGGVRLLDRDLGALSRRELRGVRHDLVSFVAQRPAENFLAHLTLAEHARLPGTRQGDAAGLLGRLGLGERLHERPAALSGGEQARAALGLALLRRTPLILLDEPTAELDESSAADLLAALREHAQEGVGFVVATHDPDVVAQADATLHLRSGRVVTEEPIARPESRPAPRATAGAPTAVRAERVSKRYRSGSDVIHAVEEATLELRAGELAVLVGRSGSGKSTLLSLLAGWQQPDAGRVVFADGDAARLSWRELAVVPQKFGLLMELSVRENVELPVRLGGRAARPVDELLAELGLLELAERVPTEISVGQQQRVAVARALVLGPAVLLADEPASHQDEGWRHAVWTAIGRAAEAGSACLAVTHETDVTAYAGAVWEMHDGRVSA